jgi:hypothetical protein
MILTIPIEIQKQLYSSFFHWNDVVCIPEMLVNTCPEDLNKEWNELTITLNGGSE